MDILLPRYNQVSASFFRDANRVPITTDGLITTDTQVFSGNNATVATPIFGITGVIEVRGLWGVVLTDLGANHTAAAWRLNDQTTQTDITAVGGTTLSAIKAGSAIVKRNIASAALNKLDNAAGILSEPSAIELPFFTGVVLGKKTGAATNIEYVYTTTDTPTSGSMQFFLRWLPLSSDAAVAAL